MSGTPPEPRKKIVQYDHSAADDTLRRGEELIRPANVEAERAMLGAIIINNDVFDAVYALARPEDCYSPQHRILYAAMLRLYERAEPIDFVTLVAELQRSNQMEEAGGEAYATALDRYCVSAWNAAEYAQIVARLAEKRRLHTAVEQLYQRITQSDVDAQDGIAQLAALIDPFQQRLEQQQAPGIGHAISASELMRLDVPDTVWVIDTMLPEGLTVIGAPPKTGKSALALQLALAVAVGGPVLGTYAPTTQGEVLYLALEDSLARLKSRLYTQLCGEEAPAALEIDTVCPAMLEGGLVRVETWLRSHEQPRMVIIDTLGRFRGDGSATEGMNAYTSDYRDLARIQALALKHHVAIVLLHHLRKGRNETGDIHEMLSGTAGISGAADCSWILAREREQDQGELHITGRDLEENAIALSFSRAYLKWSAIGNAGDVAQSQGEQRVYEAIRAYGRAATPSEIATHTGEKVGAVKMRCMRMKNAGKLVSVAGGKYWPAKPEN